MLMKKEIKLYIILHISLALYSVSAVLSKEAGKHDFLSVRFVVFYVLAVALLFIYAIGWQQVIKRIPLTTAFSNKAVTVVWGIIWGSIFFKESVTIGKAVGASMIIVGIIVFCTGKGEGTNA